MSQKRFDMNISNLAFTLHMSLIQPKNSWCESVSPFPNQIVSKEKGNSVHFGYAPLKSFQ